MSLYEKLLYVDGKRLTQAMDLDTDTAYYRDGRGFLLMQIDSSGNCSDADGKPLGKFSMRWPAETWYYTSEDGTVIETQYKLLFEKAEPHVIAQLFSDKL